jgi:mono/diheme cytochrome c family protein
MAKDRLCGLRVASVVLVGALLWVTPAGGAQQSPMVQAGQKYYMQYCATCHGKEAKGNGPLSVSLKKPAPDLTTLSKTHGGRFPYNEVLDIIDGETPYPAHGSSEMPAWGETFQSDVGGDVMQQAAIRGRLMLLTDYLKSIQQK